MRELTVKLSNTSRITAPGLNSKQVFWPYEVQTPCRNFSQSFVFMLHPLLTASPFLASRAHEDAQNSRGSWLCFLYSDLGGGEWAVTSYITSTGATYTSSVSSSSHVNYYTVLGMFSLSSLISGPPPFLNAWDLWSFHLTNQCLMKCLGYDWA